MCKNDMGFLQTQEKKKEKQIPSDLVTGFVNISGLYPQQYLIITFVLLYLKKYLDPDK